MKKAAIVLWSLVLGFALAEGAARIWLTRLADGDSFRRYGSIEMLRTRIRGSSQSLSLYVPHRYLGFIPARVVNAGASGWSSLETLINLEARVLDLEPDLAIVYHGINDVATRLV